MPNHVQHNTAEARYEMAYDEGVAFATYVRRGDTLFITHSFTPPALRGRGIANQLVREMLADIRQSGLKVVPRCSFVVDYFARHPEERDLLESPPR